MAGKNSPKRKPPNATGEVVKPWEPSEIMMRWYNAWTVECKGPSQIAKEHNVPVSRQNVCKAIHKVADWLRTMEIDEQLIYRQRVLALYEDLYRKAAKAYDESIGEIVTVTVTVVVGGENPTTTTKTEKSHGNPVYAAEKRNILKAIRELKGLDAPTKADVTTHHPEENPDIPRMDQYESRGHAMLAM